LALVDEIPIGSRVGFDTNTIIYLVEENSEYLPLVGPVWDLLDSEQIEVHLSAISLLEVLVKPIREQQDEVRRRYEETLMDTPSLRVHPVDRNVAQLGAAVRAQFGLRTPDAIVAATALASNCSFLVTNDPGFRNVNGISVLLVDEFRS
jgi:predicted nucleic acid-binding protein